MPGMLREREEELRKIQSLPYVGRRKDIPIEDTNTLGAEQRIGLATLKVVRPEEEVTTTKKSNTSKSGGEKGFR